MEDELSQLDELIESDILEALGQKVPESQEIEEMIPDNNSLELDNNEIIIEDFVEEANDIIEEDSSSIDEPDGNNQNGIISEDEASLEKEWESSLNIEEEPQNTIEEESSNQDIEIPTVSSSSLASLLSELLNNKTIEITIKIKD